MWILHLQAKSFQGEIAFIKATNKQSPLIRVHQFGLFLDREGILRCRGRVNNSTLKQDAKNPILLPNNHYLVSLLVIHTHEKTQHSGTAETLSTVRERYWKTNSEEGT